MALVWNDAKSFRRHIEAMRIFRESHSPIPSDMQILRDMPVPYFTGIPQESNRITCLTDSKGKVILVPIWKMAVPPGLQN